MLHNLLVIDIAIVHNLLSTADRKITKCAIYCSNINMLSIADSIHITNVHECNGTNIFMR